MVDDFPQSELVEQHQDDRNEDGDVLDHLMLLLSPFNPVLEVVFGLVFDFDLEGGNEENGGEAEEHDEEGLGVGLHSGTDLLLGGGGDELPVDV